MQIYTIILRNRWPSYQGKQQKSHLKNNNFDVLKEKKAHASKHTCVIIVK